MRFVCNIYTNLSVSIWVSVFHYFCETAAFLHLSPYTLYAAVLMHASSLSLYLTLTRRQHHLSLPKESPSMCTVCAPRCRTLLLVAPTHQQSTLPTCAHERMACAFLCVCGFWFGLRVCGVTALWSRVASAHQPPESCHFVCQCTRAPESFSHANYIYYFI